MSPNGIDVDFLLEFYNCLQQYLKKNWQFILVVGGGSAARSYQEAYTVLTKSRYGKNPDHEALDRIGIAATHLNAQFVRELFFLHAEDKIVVNPTAAPKYTRQVLVAGGWKPGFSTDYIAVELALQFSAAQIINLSNIEKICTGDPKKDPAAQALDTITWKEMLDLTGNTWAPGLNIPFDPIAARRAGEANLEVITAHGRNLENFCNILEQRNYIGTKIHNYKEE